MTSKLHTIFSLLFPFLLTTVTGYAQTTDSTIHQTDSLLRAADSIAHMLDTLPAKTVIKDSTASDSSKKAASGAASIRGYEIKGAIKDKNTGEGIPFATVFFPHSNIGTPADLDGNFLLQFDTPPNDTLKVQALGYDVYFRVIDRNKKEQSFFIELERGTHELNEVVVHAGEDPALLLLKKIIAHKPQNNPDRVANYKYNVYNKLEVDIQRLSKKQFESLPVPMMKKFSFIYDNLDTTSEAKPFLPFYLTETVSDYYFQREPKKTKEFIKANQLKGVDNQSITQFLGSMYQDVNSYDNFIPVFNKEFVSPISNAGAMYYKYKIKDTQTAYGHKIVLVQFSPRRNGENCFYGDFWVVDSIYALQRITLEVPTDANVNWVNRVSLYQEFAPVHDTLWFCVKNKFIADFVGPYGAKLPGLIGRKTTIYQNIVVNDTSVSNVVNDTKLKQDVYVADSARNMNEAFWADARPDTLNKNEKAIYHMLDTLDNMPLFMTYKNTLKFLTIGKKEFGPIEYGPVWNIYSRNPVEGNRFRIDLGTTPQLFKNVYLKGHLAYGVQDQRFKYGLSGLWLLQREPKPRVYIYASYIHDVDRSTSYYDEVSTDNIFSTIARKHYIPWKLAFVNEARFEFFKSYNSGFSHMLYGIHKDFTPYPPLPSAGIFWDDDGAPIPNVIATEVGVRLRYAYKEKFLTGNYQRLSLGSKYPIVEIRYGLGLKDVWKSNYSYNRASVSISDKVKIPPLGSLYYNFFAGKYWGTLPYPLLEILPGNEYYYYNRYAFSMMTRYEFIADQYAGFNIEHTTGGGIFNYIPILKKAKLRQFWTAKGIIGSLSDANTALNFNKGYEFRSLAGNPYIELGTGVENIFQIFRIDFVWRVTPKALPDEPKEKYFGIFGSVKFNF